MKTLFLILGLAFAAAASGQGTFVYYNRVTGLVVAPVYGPEPSDSSLSKQGNTASGFPAGSQTYGGALLEGTGYSAGIWAGAAGATREQLQFVPDSLRGFRTGAAAGFIDYVPVGLDLAIPSVPSGSLAAIQLRAWDNQGGTLTSWQEALSANALVGWAPIITLQLGGLYPPPNLIDLESFNLHLSLTNVPEPSTYALAGVGAIMFWLTRRRTKKTTGPQSRQ
jgi:hypothetical protein